MSRQAEPVLQLENLSFAIGRKQILRQVSFRVEAGQYVSIIGPNGAGKTTLLRCLIRYLSGWSGRVELFGRPLQDYSQRGVASLVGYVPQADAAAASYTVRQFVLMGRYPHLSALRPPRTEDFEAVAEALALTQTAALADRSLATLSGGERRAVLIAAALAARPRLLLLDEPTTFLDYRHEVELRRLLARINRERNVTVLAVTHDVNDAALDSDMVLALRDGSIVYHGPAERIMDRSLLSSIYGTEFLLVDHPQAAVPMIVPPASRQKYDPA
jgi:iron complex transport system ATP-binding protein